MANKKIFGAKSVKARAVKADTKNSAGGRAFKQSAENSLAQYAATGMLGGGFYHKAQDQLEAVLQLANQVSPEFLAKVAIFSRQQGYLKDMPALLLAILTVTDKTEDKRYFKAAFKGVVTNGKMLRNFVQIMRSGVVGRSSLGSAPKKMVQKWLDSASDEYLFKQTVGNDPSLADVIKMVHPRPSDKKRDNLYAYIIGKKYDGRSLPKLVKDFEKFKKGSAGDRVVPNVPFQMLTSLDLSDKEWKEIAKNGAWQFTRMNLNTFERHGIFKDKVLTKQLATRLADEKLVRKSMAYPYQLFQAYKNVDAGVPGSITNALHDAMEVSLENIPEFDGDVVVAIDQSGSMGSGVSGGYSYSAPVTCADVATLFAVAIKRKNPDALTLGFDTNTRVHKMDPRDTVMTNINKFRLIGGGTDCSSPIKYLNSKKKKADLVVLLSDMESWADHYGWYGGSTGVQGEWDAFKRRNPNARLVCVNIHGSTSTTQAKDRTDVLNVGGFNDRFFDVIKAFMDGSGETDFWSQKISSEINIDVD